MEFQKKVNSLLDIKSGKNQFVKQSPMKELDEIHKREGVRCIGIPME